MVAASASLRWSMTIMSFEASLVCLEWSEHVRLYESTETYVSSNERERVNASACKLKRLSLLLTSKLTSLRCIYHLQRPPFG